MSQVSFLDKLCLIKSEGRHQDLAVSSLFFVSSNCLGHGNMPPFFEITEGEFLMCDTTWYRAGKIELKEFVLRENRFEVCTR